MSIDIAASLNERQRNALLSYYMGQYIPASGNDALINLVQTPEDVYEYLLIDPLVSNAVPTSRVAQAMSSIQQYINGITMNMEPGYQTQYLDQDNINSWKGGLSQYDIWAGEVELDTYPENYIDPTLRQSQTAYFKDLITDLNQNTINNDTAQQAVMNYLNKFEQAANLTIVSGYLDSTDQTTGTYYFLGKSTTSPVQYYWRSFDMSKNIDNIVSTDAWSEWYLMNTAINEDALQGRPRLAYFNNRLYLFWFEKTTGGNATENEANENNSNTFDVINAYSSFCDFSNNWSSPYTMMSVDNDLNGSGHENYCDALFTSGVLNTACGYNQNEDTITISLYCAGSPASESNDYNDFSIEIDYWFNLSRIKAESDDGIVTILSQFLDCYFDKDLNEANQKKIQSIYQYGLFEVASLELQDSGEYKSFVNSRLTLSALNKEDFSINYKEDGSFTVNVTVPGSSIPKAYSSSADCYAGSDTGVFYYDFIPSGHNLKRMSITMEEAVSASYDRIVTIHDGYDVQNPLSKSYTYTGATTDFGGEWIIYDADTTGEVLQLEFWNVTNVIGVMADNCYINSTTPAPWTFNAYSDSAPNSWQTGSVLFTKTADAFTTNISVGTFSFNDFTQDELNAPTVIRYISVGYQDESGYGLQNEYKLTLIRMTDMPATPTISSRTDGALGTAIFLQFSDDTDISPVRLNTLFAKELINKANVSIGDLLNWDTQLTLEPAMTDSDPNTPMDFSGANGLYFWELFFYMPYLVAWRLSQEEEYSDALAWYNYIFDPAARGRDNSSDIRTQYPEPDYWSVRPLVESASSAVHASAAWLTTDPDALASAYPIHYRKAVFMAYVSTLMAAADASYRLLTNDGLSLARLQYGQVKDLLGIRPDTLIVNHWAPETLAELAESTESNVALLSYEQQAPALPAFLGQSSVADDVTTSDSFMAPVNSQLLGYWNTLDSRLYNLRHQLTIDGLPMTVPLYAPPVNPTVLMGQSVQGGSLISASSGMTVTVPPYRFTTMLQSARAAVSILSQFGQTLLSYYERKDATALQELDAQLALDISAYTLTLGQNAIDALDQDKTVLEASRSMAQQRYDHYFGLYTTGVSAGETSAMALRDSASASMTAASPLITAAMAMRTIPNIFGLADGGEEVGAPTLAAGIVLQMTGDITNLAAQQTDMSESYRRRSEEWQIQYQQAQSEVDTLNAQLDGLAVRRQGAVTSLQLAQAQQDNLTSTLNFLTTRFTQSSLYNWLTGQLSALYYQAYDAVLSLCLSAQASWQYEMGDMTSTFIQTGAWNDSYHGLLVGETLTLNLQQMESAWLSRNERRLELVKTVSLKQLDSDAFDSLTTSGKTQFSLSESLFDNDYPGHYLRQIKFVTVSLPALVGPYQDVKMTLTQSGSRTLLKADINGVNYLNDSSTGSAGNIVTNLRASQQVAVSQGLNDSGMFMLNFGDERYLPFEGTGAVSDWQISFPNATSAEQAALLKSLNDVIIQVHYTAAYGGSTFEQAVIGTL